VPSIDYGQQNKDPQYASESGSTGQYAPGGMGGMMTGLLSQAMGMQGLAGQPGQPGAPAGAAQEVPRPVNPANASVQDLAQYLASSYGIPMGRQQLVDEAGNFTRMPTSADEAAKFNYIAQAVSDQQNRQQQAKSVAALQAEAGLVQTRGRGSLATLQAGTYRALAGQYGEMQYEADDFSYFIQEEFMRRQEELVRRQEKLAKKRRRGGMYGAIAGGIVGSLVPGIGTMAGAQVGGAIGGGMF
jgi:hypothetical protein